MKRLVLAILTVAAVALPACAQTTAAVGDIPFEFVAGNMIMPAGNYAISFPNERFTVALTGADRHTHVVNSNPKEIPSGMEQSQLVFHKYGDRYFLSEIRTPMGGREFPISRMEREAISTVSAAPARQVTVVAMR